MKRPGHPSPARFCRCRVVLEALSKERCKARLQNILLIDDGSQNFARFQPTPPAGGTERFHLLRLHARILQRRAHMYH